MTKPGFPGGAGDQADLRARWLVALAAADDGDRASALRAVCSTARDSLAMSGSVVQLSARDGLLGVATGSDEAALRIADLTFTLGEGPSLDAFALRRPVLAADLTRFAARWPGFTQAAAEQGIRGVFSLPLQFGGAQLGVLDLYAHRVRSLTSDEQDLAVAFSRLAAHVALGDLPLDRAWEPLLDHRAEVHQAQGMVMVDLGVGLAEALLRMRAFAFSDGIDLLDLARDIIAGFVLPEADGETA